MRKSFTQNFSFVSVFILLICLLGLSSVNAAPVVTSFTPTSGPVGTTVTINGSNFNTTAANNIVFFGGVKATVTGASSSALSVVVPGGSSYQNISVTDITTGFTAYTNLPFVVTFTSVNSTFASSSFERLDKPSDLFESKCFEDLDGDGMPDMVLKLSTGPSGDGRLAIYKNTHDMTFSAPAYLSLAGTPAWGQGYYEATGHDVVAADLDGDGMKDLIAANGSLNKLCIFKNNSTLNNISFLTRQDISTSIAITKIAIGDLDGDSKPDLVLSYLDRNLISPIAGGGGSGTFYSVLRNTSTGGTISFATPIDITGNNSMTAISDIDGDAKPDLLTYNSDNTISVYRNTSSTNSISFATKVDITIPTAYWKAEKMFYMADVNNDGKIDLIVPDYQSTHYSTLGAQYTAGNSFSVYKNQSSAGNISFASVVDFTCGDVTGLNQEDYIIMLAINDMDGDGKVDIVATKVNGPDANSPLYTTSLYLYRNTTTGGSVSFGAPFIYSQGLTFSGSCDAGPSICDIDRDGKPDILTPDFNYGYDPVFDAGFSIFRNRANEPAIDSFNLGAIVIDSMSINNSHSNGMQIAAPHQHRSLNNVSITTVVKGDRFLGATSVSFDGVEASSFHVDSSIQITAVVDSAAAATQKIKVTTPFGIATLPVGTVSAKNYNFCLNTDTLLTKVVFKGDNGIPPYRFTYKINTGAQKIITSAAGDSALVYLPSTSVAGTFTVTLVSVMDLYGNKQVMNKKVILYVVNAVPGTPAVITGVSTNICAGDTQTYTTAGIIKADSYLWTAPANTTIISGQGTTSIRLAFLTGYATGALTVKGVNCVGTGVARSLTLTLKAKPVTPGTITGTTPVCIGSSYAYSIAAVANATSYTWSAPANTSIVSGQGTTNVTVSIQTGYITANLSVTANNCGGSSVAKTLSVAKAAAPATPSVITGTTTVVPPVTYTYSVTNVVGITYNWVAPAHTTILSGQGTNSISLTFDVNFVTAVLSVTANNACGGASVAKTLTITKNAGPATPGTITGTTPVCIGQTYSYYIASVAGATSYTWTPPAHSTVISGQGTTSVTVSFQTGYVTANLSVTASNSSGTSAAKTLSVAKATAAATPGAITGSVAVCAGTYAYSIAAAANATSYTWTVPSGATLVSGQGTTAIQVTYPGGYTSSTLSVTATSCGGTSAAKSVTIAPASAAPATPGVITGALAVCPGTYTYYIADVVNALTYTWVAPSNASITAGQGTNTVSVTFVSGFITGNLTVTADNCIGSSVAKTLALKTIPAAPAAITGPITDVCNTTTGITYSVAPILGASSYNWVVTGGTITGGQGTTNITVNFPSTFASATVKVQEITSCSSAGAYKSITVTQNGATPGTITGTTPVCPTLSYSYSVVAVPNAVSYVWAVPSGWTISSGQGTNTLNVIAGAIAGKVMVSAANTCGNGAAASKTIAIGTTCRLANDDEPIEKQEDINLDMKIYPNPANGNEVSIELNGVTGNTQIQFFDLMGQKVTPCFYTKEGVNTFNISYLSNGIYFVELRDGSARKTERLLIQK